MKECKKIIGFKASPLKAKNEKGICFYKFPLLALEKYFPFYKGEESRFLKIETEEATTENRIEYYTETEVSVKKELDFIQMIFESIKIISSKIKKKKYKIFHAEKQFSNSFINENFSLSRNTGDSSISSATGSSSIALNDGYFSIASVTREGSVSFARKNSSISSSTGDMSSSVCMGYESISAGTGMNSISHSKGDFSISCVTGIFSKSFSSGKNSIALSIGENSLSITEGKDSVAIAFGKGSKAKGKIGSWVACTEWDENSGELLHFKATKVDGEEIKADTFYCLRKGKFVELDC